MARYLRSLTCILAVLFPLVSAPGIGESADPVVAVLVSNAGAPYDETLSGFRKHLEAKDIKASYKVYALAGDSAKAAQSVSDIRPLKPSLILCIGSLAAERVTREIADVPIVAAMVLRAEDIKRSSNATGVFLDFPMATQLQWVKRFLPKAKTVGIIYNAKENAETLEAAKRAAQKVSLSIKAEEVEAARDLPAALDRLANVDVLLGIVDGVALTPLTAKQVLLFSFRNRIPFVGPSPQWVKAGALYALDWDYAGMGSQAADMAARILQGSPASTIQPAPSQKVYYVVNRKTADELGVKIPEELLREARTLF